MRSRLIICLLLVGILCESGKEIFQQLHRTGEWGEGISSNECYNMDYLIRLQRTVDYQGVRKIVEIGFGDWRLTRLIHLQDKQYVGYEIVGNLVKDSTPKNVELKYINSIRDILEDGDLLIVKDVLMYLPNTDITYVLDQLVPRFKYALIEISATDAPHSNVQIGKYRPLKLNFKNGTKVIEKIYKSTRKETWLIRNNLE